ncbi:MAG: hypothetical protein AABX01_04960 [Candidatus Micrarchaeota archaeon]
MKPPQQPNKIPEVPLPALVIFLLIVFAVGIYKYGSPFDNFLPSASPAADPTIAPTATPGPFGGGILAGAFFYKGPRPSPKMIPYYDEQGNNRTAFALPGELMVRAPAKATRAEVEKKLAAVGVNHKLLGAIPAIGSYLVEVPQGQEAYFISALRALTILRAADGNYSAIPNFVLSADDTPAAVSGTRIINFSDDGVPLCGEMLYTPAYLGTPDPSAKVIVALIDSFARDKPAVPSHGDNTEAALRSTCQGCPLQKIDVGKGSVGFDVIERAFAFAIAGAEINCQDVVVSLSFNPFRYYNLANHYENLSFYDEEIRNLDSNYDYGEFMKMLLGVMANSKWALAGHVKLHNSAGNGVLLCAPAAPGETLCSVKEKVMRVVGIDLTQAMDYLRVHPAYGSLMRSYVEVWCAYEHGMVQLASYSNYGPKIDCKEPYGGLLGTSFSAPLGAGEDYVAIKKRIAGEGQDCNPSWSLPMPTCPPGEIMPTPVIVTPRPTAIPDTACTSDAQCTSDYAAKYCKSGDEECRTLSTYWRCGFDKVCHMCLYKRGMSIEGEQGDYLGCMSCQEGLDAGLRGDGCPEQFYCERGTCVLQSGTKSITTS